MITEMHAGPAGPGSTGTSTTGRKSATAETDAGDRVRSVCTVCPHPWDAHDRIGLRYCTATAAGGFSRGCVCVGDTVNE